MWDFLPVIWRAICLILLKQLRVYLLPLQNPHVSGIIPFCSHISVTED